MSASAALLSVLLAAPAGGPPPNVVLIRAADLGYADVGAYGQTKIRTPSIDRLAAEGMRFARHYAGNAACAPSRSVLMTGQHPGHTPIRDNRQTQPEGRWPLPGVGGHARRAAEGTGLPHGGHGQVPAIVRRPKRVAAGTVTDRVTGLEDWMPALLALAGADAPTDIDGISFAETLLGRKQGPRAFPYREVRGYGGQQSVLAGGRKTVRQGLSETGVTPRTTERYDLASDPGETRNVAASHPEVLARLEALLRREHTRSADFPIPAIDDPAKDSFLPPRTPTGPATPHVPTASAALGLEGTTSEAP
jgi:arylsulfatase A-like enzyme